MSGWFNGSLQARPFFGLQAVKNVMGHHFRAPRMIRSVDDRFTAAVSNYGVAQRTPQFRSKLQRPRLAAGDRSHSCRNLDCDRLAGYGGLLPSRVPTAYSGPVVPA